MRYPPALSVHWEVPCPLAWNSPVRGSGEFLSAYRQNPKPSGHPGKLIWMLVAHRSWLILTVSRPETVKRRPRGGVFEGQVNQRLLTRGQWTVSLPAWGCTFEGLLLRQ